MLEGPRLREMAFPTPMVWPLDESQGSSPLEGHGSWLMCEVALIWIVDLLWGLSHRKLGIEVHDICVNSHIVDQGILISLKKKQVPYIGERELLLTSVLLIHPAFKLWNSMHLGVIISSQLNMNLVLKDDPELVWSKSFEMNRQHIYGRSSFDVGWMRGTLICINFLCLPTCCEPIQSNRIPLHNMLY